MKPGEIRKWAAMAWSHERKITEALIEIAAQLAEMNEPINGEAPVEWVWFMMADGVKQVFRKDSITNVQSFEDKCAINDKWERRYLIFEPIKDVCRKLGIPMEGK